MTYRRKVISGGGIEYGRKSVDEIVDLAFCSARVPLAVVVKIRVNLGRGSISKDLASKMGRFHQVRPARSRELIGFGEAEPE